MSGQQQAEASRYTCPTCRSLFRTGMARCPLDGSALQEAVGDPLAHSRFLDRYVIEECIGQGGMGRVYRARHARMKSKRFAIKVLFGDLAADPKMRTRFAREAEAASRLSHRNVISVIDAGESPEGLIYLAMEYVEGRSLTSLIAQEGPLECRRVASFVRQLAAGLDHAHRNKLIHRDFKPDNILVTQRDEGEVLKILDFGIAHIMEEGSNHRLTTDGMVMGTPAFMPPEQAMGGAIDHRADLFSLGLIVYEMLAGALPFDGPPMAIMRQNLSLEPPRIGVRIPGMVVDPQLEDIAFKLMAKNPDDRYQSGKELVDIIDALWIDSSQAWGAPIRLSTEPSLMFEKMDQSPTWPPTEVYVKPLDDDRDTDKSDASLDIEPDDQTELVHPVAPARAQSYPTHMVNARAQQPGGRNWTRLLIPLVGLAIAFGVVAAVVAQSGDDGDIGADRDHRALATEQTSRSTPEESNGKPANGQPENRTTGDVNHSGQGAGGPDSEGAGGTDDELADAGIDENAESGIDDPDVVAVDAGSAESIIDDPDVAAVDAGSADPPDQTTTAAQSGSKKPRKQDRNPRQRTKKPWRASPGEFKDLYTAVGKKVGAVINKYPEGDLRHQKAIAIRKRVFKLAPLLTTNDQTKRDDAYKTLRALEREADAL